MPEIAPESSPNIATVTESKEKTSLPAPSLPAPPQPEKPPPAQTQGTNYPVLGVHVCIHYIILLYVCVCVCLCAHAYIHIHT